ncbi:single-stranded DNA-binding protein [Pedobacter sp. HMF7647]|uniref:Single-stranded DNA-binding protein n=1 Tax=Hufsiella arboris TaxID=2695275 RepID=A0A7K1YDM0_9SPHI|nr:single-stranded DNA-binding protein [Hufsiella arboris]MXV52693.1 single-stranded DNA-binding protein [Hufsiella arboris]
METQTNNSVRLTGFIGKDPEVKEIGKSQLVRFSMATNHSYKNLKGEWMKDTHWHNIVIWNKIDAIDHKRLSKGTEVSIEGRLVSRSYTDKKGNKHYLTEIVVNEISVLEKNRKDTAQVA